VAVGAEIGLVARGAGGTVVVGHAAVCRTKEAERVGLRLSCRVAALTLRLGVTERALFAVIVGLPSVAALPGPVVGSWFASAPLDLVAGLASLARLSAVVALEAAGH